MSAKQKVKSYSPMEEKFNIICHAMPLVLF